MHCDDKRTLYVLRAEIEKTLKLLQDSEYCDQNLLESFNNAVTEYVECKLSS
jgi:hypothetical protein